MIDIFYRRRDQGELSLPRVHVTTVPDLDRAITLIDTLTATLPTEGETQAAAGRPSRRRLSVAKLVELRDTALDREIAANKATERHALSCVLTLKQTAKPARPLAS
jgi:hypothetical protein